MYSWRLPGPHFPCTMILVGKDATAGGSVLLAHNNDLPDPVPSLIHIVPAVTHAPGEMVRFKNGLEVSRAAYTQRLLIMQCHYGFAEGDARAINEHRVAVAGGLSLKDDRSDRAREADPLVPGGVTGYVRYIALQRAGTARQCVEIIGEMYSRYGIAYPSAVGVADPDEVWYIEAGGGRCWAARRVPDGHYLAAANGYRIGDIDFDDRANFIYPSYLKNYAQKKGLWQPGKYGNNSFNFAAIFGGKKAGEGDYYNARRVWRIQRLLTPGLHQDPGAFVHPLTLEPGEKITIPRLIRVLRDRYQGTPFGVIQPGGTKKERVIGTFRTVHTAVIQLRSGVPPEIGAVMWGGLGPALTTPYIPYYYGTGEIPAPFRTAGPGAKGRSAFTLFRSLADLLEPRLSQWTGDILPVWQDLEKRMFVLQGRVERTALECYKRDPELAREFLTRYSNDLALEALEKARELKTLLEARLPGNHDRND